MSPLTLWGWNPQEALHRLERWVGPGQAQRDVWDLLRASWSSAFRNACQQYPQWRWLWLWCTKGNLHGILSSSKALQPCQGHASFMSLMGSQSSWAVSHLCSLWLVETPAHPISFSSCGSFCPRTMCWRHEQECLVFSITHNNWFPGDYGSFTLSLPILTAPERRMTCPITEAKLKETLRSKQEKMWVWSDKMPLRIFCFRDGILANMRENF